MAHLTYEEGKKRVVQGLLLLGGVTIVEVIISLLGKGHLIPGVHHIQWLLYVIGLSIIVLSLYKAYFIIYEFMHMKYELRGLALTVLLPTVLLIWAIIAFFQEGNSWKNRREQIKEKNLEPAEGENPGGLSMDDTYIIDFSKL
jgi:cytochrome c oxidase subunit IV